MKKISTYPIVVIKLGAKESSEKRSKRQLFPTPIILNEYPKVLYLKSRVIRTTVADEKKFD